MTLSASAAVDRYAAAELQTVFPYTFKILDASHLQVFEGDTEITSGFAVSGVGSDSGGNVSYSTAPRGSGAPALTVTLKRAVPLSQPDDLPTAGALNTDTLESMIDKSRMIDQQLDEVDARSLRVPVSSSLTGLEVTPAAGQLIGFDAAGTALATYAAAAIVAGIVPTTLMQTLLGDATITAALATLGIANQEQLSVDGAGRLSVPGQPAFMAHKSVAQDNTFGAGGSADVTFGTTIKDQGGNFDGTSFTAPVPGFYLLWTKLYMVDVAGAHTALVMGIQTPSYNYNRQVNPGAIRETNTGDERLELEVTAITYMDAADTAKVNLSINGGTAIVDLPATTSSQFGGLLLAA